MKLLCYILLQEIEIKQYSVIYKAIEDVVKVWTDILKQDRTLKNLFELPPHIICTAKIDDGRR